MRRHPKDRGFGYKKSYDYDKSRELEYAVSILDEAYSKVISIVRSDDDHETINIIQPILDKIDEIQNEIESIDEGEV